MTKNKMNIESSVWIVYYKWQDSTDWQMYGCAYPSELEAMNAQSKIIRDEQNPTDILIVKVVPYILNENEIIRTVIQK